MPRRVERSEVLDYETYEEQRNEIRERIFEIKRPRRIHLGDCLTFLFENHDTTLYQIQEMMRAEKLVKESAIQHEIDTYNGLLGGPDVLAAALLIEIGDPTERRSALEAWLELPKHLFMRVADGTRVYAKYDLEQVGDDRLSAVQYLEFPVEGRPPTHIGTDYADSRVNLEVGLTEPQMAALREDLAETSHEGRVASGP